MNFARAITNVLATTLLFAFLGTGIGFALGQFTPGYYRSIFRVGQNTEFDPVPTGIALGLTQGAAAGAVIGLALVALLCWRDVRRERVESESTMTVPRRETSFRTLRVVGSLLLLVVVAGIAFLLGAIFAEQGAYHRQYETERQALAPVASDPAFAGIEFRRRSNGGVDLYGKMPTTPDDKLRLQAVVIKAVGESRAKEILGSIYQEEQQ